MKLKTLLILLQTILCEISIVFSQTYTPDWNSLDKRPLPKWYDDSKVGIFIHWGVFSVPAFRSEWFWWDWQGNPPQQDVAQFMAKNYPPGFTYADFAKDFKAEYFDPDYWADLFKESGAKYVVLTSKHHEGYCLWPSVNSWNWNSMDIGPNRDLVGDLANSIRKRTNLTFGLYHSLFEWFNPLYLNDKKSGFKTQEFVKYKTMPELYDIVNKYKPELIWSDGEWETTDSYWNSTNFIAWLYNESPVKDTIVVNDRWGAGDLCKHGDYFTCTDRYNPGKLINHKWENAMTLDTQSWGFRRNMMLSDVISIEDLISQMVETVSCGGNILINIGPTKEGIIVPIFEERLKQLGSWLNINGESIYSTRPWKYQNDTTNPNVWYTTNNNIVYAILLKYPIDTLKVQLSAPKATSLTKVNLIGYDGEVQWIQASDGIVIDISTLNPMHIKSNWVWVFRLYNVE